MRRAGDPSDFEPAGKCLADIESNCIGEIALPKR